MTINPKTLRMFISVLEQGTISGAAVRENIAPAALSRRLSELEDSLGVALLDRSNKGISPTAAGRELVARAHRVLNEIADLDSHVRDFTAGRKGRVRIHANISAITQFLPEELAMFLDSHPDVTVDLHEEVSTAIIEAVLDHRADIGVITVGVTPHVGELIPYREDRLVVIVPPSHPLCASTFVKFSETLGYNYVGLQRGSQLNALLEWAARTHQAEWKLRFHVSNYDALCRMVECGLGIGVLPIGVADRYAHAFPVRKLHLDEDWAARRLAVFVRDAKKLSPSAAALVHQLCTASERKDTSDLFSR